MTRVVKRRTKPRPKTALAHASPPLPTSDPPPMIAEQVERAATLLGDAHRRAEFEGWDLDDLTAFDVAYSATMAICRRVADGPLSEREAKAMNRARAALRGGSPHSSFGVDVAEAVGLVEHVLHEEPREVYDRPLDVNRPDGPTVAAHAILWSLTERFGIGMTTLLSTNDVHDALRASPGDPQAIVRDLLWKAHERSPAHPGVRVRLELGPKDTKRTLMRKILNVAPAKKRRRSSQV
jgi:hypothetical protein